MSQSRHTAASAEPERKPERAAARPRDRVAVRSTAVGFSSDYRWSNRRSEWGELLWASRGAITVTIDETLWIVPAREALWLPPGIPHTVQLVGRGVLRSLYLQRSRCRQLARTPRVVGFGSLLRELVRRVLERQTLDLAIRSDAHLLAVLCDELAAQLSQPAIPVDLPMPRDPRALRAAHLIMATPGEPAALPALAKESAASTRTLERLFARETGLTLGAWRQRAALIHGIKALAEGSTVTHAALAAGYSSTSAFIAATKRLTGRTPGQQRRRQA